MNLAFILFTTRTAIFTSILGYALLGNDLTAQKVFVVTCCFNLLKHTMTDFFPYAISQVAVAYVSVKRIQKFLLYEETPVDIATNFIKDDISENKNEKEINIKNVVAKWNIENTANTLSDITIQIMPEKITTIIGPVGCGKTSLLHIVLKELILTDGSLQVNGTVSYASQEPWLFAGSVRQNILFGLPMNKLKYQKVIKCCALERDLLLLPYGDKTIVGEKGVSLSGGQRARINLARAIYKDADIYLLDDPLSAVDTNVGKEIFDWCIKKYLKAKTVVLVTHQLQYLKETDQIIILNNGMVEAKGTYHHLKSTGLNFAQLLDDNPEETKLNDDFCTLERVPSIKSINSMTSYENKEIESPLNEEHRSKGKVSKKVYFSYFTAANNSGLLLLTLILFILSQVLCTASDYFVTYW